MKSRFYPTPSTSTLKRAVFFIGLCMLLLAGPVQAQQGGTYIRAQQLMQKNQYEEAYTLLTQLLNQNPENYPVFDSAITCLIQLKRYDEAMNMTRSRLNGRWQDVVTATRLADIYHTAGDTAAAVDAWDRTIQANRNQLNAYRYVAENMNTRGEYARANALYRQARELFGAPTLFILEMAANYMRLRAPENAAAEFIRYLEENPQTTAIIQRQFTMYDDTELYNAAIMELEDRAGLLTPSSPAYQANRDLLITILMEQKLFRRALSTARSYERQAVPGIWPLFTLSQRLRSVHAFELAEEALSYYTGQPVHPMHPNGLEEMAVLYVTWSRYLVSHNLDYRGRSDDLYRKAGQLLSQVSTGFPGYERLREVAVLQAEIALDYLKDTRVANEQLAYLESIRQSNETIVRTEYIRGRILLFEGNFTMARLHLSRSNRLVRTGEMADRTRYYLAKTDFYSGDFEFSRIQLRALERTNTSFFANDALQLRLWMQTGIQKDSVSQEMTAFSRAVYYAETGQPDKALAALMTILRQGQGVPLRPESYQLAADIIRKKNPKIAWYLLTDALNEVTQSAGRERLMWDAALLTDGMEKFLSDSPGLVLQESIIPLAQWLVEKEPELRPQLLMPDGQLRADVTVTVTRSDVIRMYESILMEFPQGFYAQRVRDRLLELQKETETI